MIKGLSAYSVNPFSAFRGIVYIGNIKGRYCKDKIPLSGYYTALDHAIKVIGIWFSISRKNTLFYNVKLLYHL